MSAFIEALYNKDIEKIRKCPKADLHNHFVLLPSSTGGEMNCHPKSCSEKNYENRKRTLVLQHNAWYNVISRKDKEADYYERYG